MTGSIIEDTSTTAGKTIGASTTQAQKPVQEKSPAVISPTPAVTHAQEIINVNKTTEPPKTEIKEAGVDSEEVVGQVPIK